jgi:hypothetical protein
MDSISDAAEMFLRFEHLERERQEQYNSLSAVIDATESLLAMGFEIVTDPCDECMFTVRGGMIPRLKRPEE